MKYLSNQKIKHIADTVLIQLDAYLIESAASNKDRNLVAADSLLKLVTLLAEYHGHLKVYAHTMCEQPNSN